MKGKSDLKVLLAAIVVSSATGCSKPASVDQTAPPQELPPMVIAATPAPPAPELAPEGVFYLVTAISTETDSGIHAMTPGTGVKHVRGDIYQTPFGEMKLLPNQITNDMGVARAVRNAALASQAALRRSGAETAATESENARMESTIARQDNLNSLKLTELSNRVSALTNQKTALESQIAVLKEKAGRESYGRSLGRAVSGTSTEQLASARTRLDQLETELYKAQRALRDASR